MTSTLRVLAIVAVGFLLGVTARIDAQPSGQTPYISWSLDGTLIAAGSGNTVTILEAQTLQSLYTIGGIEEQLTETVWSPDGSRLAIASGRHVIVWDVERNRMVRDYRHYVIDGSTAAVSAITWSPNGSRIVSAIDGDVVIWSPATGMDFTRFVPGMDYIPALIWYPDDVLLVSDDTHAVYLLEPYTLDHLTSFNTAFPPTGEISLGIGAAARGADGDFLAVGDLVGGIELWSNIRLAGFHNRDYSRTMGDGAASHTDAVLSLDFSPNGVFLASSSRDGTVRVWDVIFRDQVALFNVGMGIAVNSVAWSPDGSRLAYGNADGSVTLIDASQFDSPMFELTATSTPIPTITPTATVTLPPDLIARAGRVQVLSGANLREGPGTEFAIAGSAAAGQRLYVLSEITNDQGIWYEVFDLDGVAKWVNASLVEYTPPPTDVLATATPPASLEMTTAPTLISTVTLSSKVEGTVLSGVNLRGGPGRNYPVVGSATTGTTLPVIAYADVGTDRWYIVIDLDGQAKWVSAGYLQLDPGAVVTPAATIPAPP